MVIENDNDELQQDMDAEYGDQMEEDEDGIPVAPSTDLN